MKPLSAETRALLDDLRASERVSPSQVDHAWRRFTARQVRRRRVTLGLWLGAGLAAAAAAVVLVPSLRTRVGAVDDAGRGHEAIMQRGGAPPREAEAAGPGRTTAAGALPSEALQTSPAPAEPAPASATRATSAASRRVEARSTRGSTTETVAASETGEPADASAPSLAAELALLDEAEAALRRGEHERAAKLLGDHRERFPAGALVEERDMLDARISAARASE